VKKEDLNALPLMVELFQSFEKQKDVDPKIVWRIQRRWTQRLLTSTLGPRWKHLWKAGILQNILKDDPFLLSKSIIKDLPAKLFRKTRRSNAR
jgi:hypothetical protein